MNAVQDLGVGICVLDVPFTLNVNRIEVSRLMAGADALGLAFAWGRLKLLQLVSS